jgi:RNA polymerase sigma factor (TIGR02999 family)
VSTASTDVTRLIDRVQSGDEAARRDLWTLLYGELRRLAAGQMVRERDSHTLEPTALVHEAWLRLAGDGELSCENRAHFFGIAAEAMRRILVDHARRRGTLRRGGDLHRVALVEALDGDGHSSDGVAAGDIEAVDEALTRLEDTGRHDRKCQVVKLRFFAGLTNEQAAELIGISISSVKRDWEFAKAWLTREIRQPEQPPRSESSHGPPR